MVDEPTPDPRPVDPKLGDKTFTQGDLDRIVADRLKREAAKYSDYDDLKAKAVKFAELEEKDKTETQKLTDANRSLEERARKAEIDLCRYRVAMRKGLTETQARRLVGASEEELETDADDLVAAFANTSPTDPEPPAVPAGSRPKEKLRPGTVPDAEPEETDPAKLAATIPRY